MRTQWTTKGNRDTGSSCSCDGGLHRYSRNFGGGFELPPRYATDVVDPIETPFSGCCTLF